MANNIYGAIALIGGGVGALDAIDGTGLADKDMAYVSVAGITYNYILNPTLNQVTSSPSVIQPVSNPGTKDWVLTKDGSDELMKNRKQDIIIWLKKTYNNNGD